MRHAPMENRNGQLVDLPGERSEGDGGARCGSSAPGRCARTRIQSPDARSAQGRQAGLTR